MLKKILFRRGITPRIAAGTLGLTLALTLALAGCVAEDQTSSPLTTEEKTKTATGPFKIGAVLPLTGNGAAYGEPMQKVAQIAIDEINTAGGINGQKLEFIWEDGRCDGSGAATAGNKLIDVDKVEVIYGGFCSSETLAIAPIAERNKVIVFSPGSSSPDISEAGEYIYRNYPSDSSQGKILAEESSRRGYKKVAMLVEQNDYTLGIKNAFEKNFNRLGGGNIDVQTFLPDDTDFRTALVKLKSASPDALLIAPQTPASADLILKQFEEQKWQVPLIAIDVVAGYQDLISKYSKTLEGTLTAEFQFDRNNSDFATLKNKYKELHGADMPYEAYATTVYDAVYILKEALEKVGNDGDKIKDYLNGISDRKGLAGTLNFDENGDPKAGHMLEVIKKGKILPYTVSDEDVKSSG